jgi:hypothetical protein
VMKPARNNFSSSRASTPKTRVRPRCAVPSDFTRANSTGRTNRLVFGSDKLGDLGVSGMVPPYHRRTGADATPTTGYDDCNRYSKSLPAEILREDFD